MGKEEPETPKDTQNSEPKKIIKKVAFKMLGKGSKDKNKEDDLKDWKPMKISESVEQQKK